MTTDEEIKDEMENSKKEELPEHENELFEDVKFNLSEKIMPCIHGTPELKEINRHDILMIQDVKEFIRLFKKETCMCNKKIKCDNCTLIDKLAGDKLI